MRVAAAEKALSEIYNCRRDELDPTGDGRTKLEAVRRRLLLVEKGALHEARRKQILSEEIVRKRLQKLDEQLLNLEDD